MDKAESGTGGKIIKSLFHKNNLRMSHFTLISSLFPKCFISLGLLDPFQWIYVIKSLSSCTVVFDFPGIKENINSTHPSVLSLVSQLF